MYGGYYYGGKIGAFPFEEGGWWIERGWGIGAGLGLVAGLCVGAFIGNVILMVASLVNWSGDFERSENTVSGK